MRDKAYIAFSKPFDQPGVRDTRKYVRPFRQIGYEELARALLDTVQP